MPILCGSEGTLAGIFSAQLQIVPLPEERGVGLIFFSSVAEAMQATTALLALEPAAIEHVDRPLFDQPRGQREFEAVRALLDGLQPPPGAETLPIRLQDVQAVVAAEQAGRLPPKGFPKRNKFG